jgi:NCS1 family nucleobase:cation symporter-1
MALYSFIGVAVTSATTIIYGQTIWDPVDAGHALSSNPRRAPRRHGALCIATLATNIAANVVSPANDFANLAPQDRRSAAAAYITGLIGILMMPWKLVADPSGVHLHLARRLQRPARLHRRHLIADYFVCRGRNLDLKALYDPHGEHSYTNGFSTVALIALILAVMPALPGFLAQVRLIDSTGLPPFLLGLYNYAWFAGFGIAFAVYVTLRKLAPHS